LIRQRTSLGLSQKESAKRLGIDPSTLASWEQGKKEPTEDFLNGSSGFSATMSNDAYGEQDSIGSL
jgi:transcriptional regulator with XRE-family HTH domain